MGRPATGSALVTSYFQDGHCQVLVGTRALLGEGWDAQADHRPRRRHRGHHHHLASCRPAAGRCAPTRCGRRRSRSTGRWSASPTSTPRAATTGTGWSASTAATSASTPTGRSSTGSRTSTRLFSPFVPPPVAEFDAANARAMVRSEQRATIRDQWQVGQPYVDAAVYGIRIKERGVAGRRRLRARAPVRPTSCCARTPPSCAACAGTQPATGPRSLLVGAGVLAALVAGVAGAPLVLAGGVLVGLAAAYARVRSHLRHGEELLHGAEEAPSVIRIASAVADGLLAAGLVRRGADSVEVALDAEGEYRCVLHGVDEVEAQLFADRPRRGGLADQPAALPAAALGADPAQDITWWRVDVGRLRPGQAGRRGLARRPDRPRRQRRAGRGLRQGLGPLGRRRRPRLHRARPRARASSPPSRAPTRSPPARSCAASGPERQSLSHVITPADPGHQQ